MADRNYLRDPTNPFFSLEDDVDDETFLRSAPSYSAYPSSSKYTPSSSSYTDYGEDLERKRQELLQRRQEIEDRTLASSSRSVHTLKDSEDVGIATAEELVRQREQLERTERRLDEINNTLRFSQKHIQGIKSVFGGLRNYFSTKLSDQPGLVKSPTSPTAGPSFVPSSGPSAREDPDSSVYGYGASSSGMGLGDNLPGTSSSSNSALLDLLNRPSEKKCEIGRDHPLFNMDTDEPNFRAARNVAEQLEHNLDEMSGSIARLKNLAIGLSEEIDTQNDILDVLAEKTENADMSINRQNKDIRNLLRK